MKVYPLTCGPIIKGTEDESNNIRIWGRAYYYHIGILRYREQDKNTDNYTTIMINCDPNNDFTFIIELDKLRYDCVYEYQMGICRDMDENYDWSMIEMYTFKTNKDKRDVTSFIFGSCRRYTKIGPTILFGTGEEGDKIYESIYKHKDIDFFLSIGDQVYFDPMGRFLRITALKDMRKLYRKVRKQEHIKKLMANITTYEICDDHDIQCNNSNHITREKEPQVFANGLQSYKEYQHVKHINCDDNLWYSFKRNNCRFFVFDTRSQRTSDKIIIDEQMNEFKKWLKDNKKYIKFVVSPVPLLSQPVNDSWFGFPKQQKKVVELILKYNCIVLTGDAHCGRAGVYKVYNKDNEELGNILEIISSGLVAVAHDSDKDFPNEINNTYNGGLKFKTIQKTCCYPMPNEPNGIIDNIKSLFTRVIDNIFIKIIVSDNLIVTLIYNQDNIVLDQFNYYL